MIFLVLLIFSGIHFGPKQTVGETAVDCFAYCANSDQLGYIKCKSAIFHQNNCYFYSTTELVDSLEGNTDNLEKKLW